MSEVQTHPKTAQLSRGPKRPARIKATRQEWATIRAAKHGPCRCYGIECAGRVELHHIVPRSWGGDDLPDNIAPLCTHHHADVTEYRNTRTLERLAESLTDAEYSYAIGKLGEGALERLFGVLSEASRG